MQTASSTNSMQVLKKNISCKKNYGNCRCCLAIGQHSRIRKAQLDMLVENLNILLTADSRLPQFICASCITSLNAVQRFRQKVLASERKLLQVITVGAQMKSQEAAIPTVKVGGFPQDDPLEISEVKVTDVKTECYSETEESLSVDITFNPIAGSSHNEPIIPIEMDKVKTEQDTAEQDPLVESDDNAADDSTEFAEIAVKIEESEFENVPTSSEETMSIVPTPHIKPDMKNSLKTTLKRKSQMDSQDAKKIPNAVFKYINIGDKSERASDNNKIRANIMLILQNSTVLPFRTIRANGFKCFFCEKTCGLFSDLKHHTETIHKNGVSDHTIFKSLKARNQKIIHADISNAKCKLCNTPITTIDNLVQHLTDIHKKVYYDIKNEAVKVPTHGVIGFILNIDCLKCHLCQTEFRFVKNFTSHVTKHYGCFPCPSCDQKFVTAEEMKKHCKTHEQTETKCTDCNLVFNTRRTMLVHRYIKHIRKRKDPKCSECSKTFPISRPTLRFEHMEKEHGIRRPIYKCEACNKTYQTIHGINYHTRSVHTKKNEYMCDICGYVTTDKTVMKRHLDHHSGVRKFECDYCHKKFRTKGNLRLHMRGHFNDKRFACSLCDAAFIQKHCLKNHIKSRHPHSGIDVNLL